MDTTRYDMLIWTSIVFTILYVHLCDQVEVHRSFDANESIDTTY